MKADTTGLFDRFLDTLYRVFRDTPRDYCEVETTADQYTLVLTDCSHVSILRLDGIRSLVGPEEFENIIDTIHDVTAPFMDTGHHSLTSYFRADEMSADRVKEQMRPMYDTATRLGMSSDMHDILDDQAETLAPLCMDQETYIAVWTYPSLLTKDEHAKWRDEANDLFRNGQAPNPRQAQDGTRAIPVVMERHHTFLNAVISALRRVQASASILQTGDGVQAQKRSIEPRTTPLTWQPALLTNIAEHHPRVPPDHLRTVTRKDGSTAVQIDNIAALFPPKIAKQIVSSNVRYTAGRGYLVYGERMYASVVMELAPRRSTTFQSLMSSLRNARVRGLDGSSKSLPFSIYQEIHGNGLKALSMRSLVGSLMPFNDNNKDFNRAIRYLRDLYNRDREVITRYSFSLTTWVDADVPNAEQELSARLTKLTAAVQQWGDATVTEYSHDRLQALFSGGLALTRKSVGKFAAPTYKEALRLLPLDRPTSPFTKQGVEIYRSADGRVMSTTAHSDEQDYYLHCDIAGMGGGKSVQANRRHMEFLLQPGLQELPYLHIIDVGESASGVISLLEDALPAERKHEVFFVRLRNDATNAINMLDTPLGLRYPPESHLDTMVDWLTALVTPAERGKPYENMSSFVKIILKATYLKMDDGNDQGSPNLYLPGYAPMVDDAVQSLGIQITPDFTNWWSIVDQLYEAGKLKEAIIAQRFCSPQLSHVESVAADPNVVAELKSLVSEGNMPIQQAFLAQLKAVKQEFPIFTDITRLDLRGRRVTVIDLNDVTIGDSPAGRKRASLMYMVAYNLFVRNVRFAKEDLAVIPQLYYSYYAKLVADLEDVPKHVTIDEYHRTSIVDQSELARNPDAADAYGLRRTLQREGGRESRKWKLSMTTISQRPGDHGGLLALASSVFVLKTPEDPHDLAVLQDKMDLGKTGTMAIKSYLNGPQPGVGANVLARYNLKDGKFTQLLTSTLGGKLMWSMCTTPEDKALRRIMYDELGNLVARTVLRYHYPGGSAKSEIMRRKSKMSSGQDLRNQDFDKSAMRALADELIGFYRANPQNYAVRAR